MVAKNNKVAHISILLFIFCTIPANSVSANLNLKPILSKICVIAVFDAQNQPIRLGSGFPVGTNGEICTNFHVIQGAGKAIVKFVNSEKNYEVKGVSYFDETIDLAILKISKNTTSLNMGNDLLAEIGDRIYAFGNPEGLEGTVSEGTVSEGIISGFRRIKDDFRLIQITAPISPGSSGGPIVNFEGNVIGISSASIISGQNLNFAIPVTDLKTLLKKPAHFTALLDIPEKQIGVELNQKMKKPSDLVKIVNIKRTGQSSTGDGSLSFSIQNNSSKDISNIRFVISWYTMKPVESKKRKFGRPNIVLVQKETIHFNPIIVRGRVPSLRAKIFKKENLTGVGLVPENAEPEVRILDYKIHKSSKVLEFQ